MKTGSTYFQRLYQKIVLVLKSRLTGQRMRFLRSEISDSRLISALRAPFPGAGDFRTHLKSLLSPLFPIRAADREELVSLLRRQFPDDESRTVKAAERIRGHLFDLLGSGETDLGPRIDWHRDFVSGHRWEERSFFTHLRPAPDPGGYDIKVPWELSRCRHFITLGKAYWYTGNEKYAREVIREIEDWIARNPPHLGVNWVCAMEASIRVANWIVGFYFIVDSPSLGKDFVVEFLKSLLIHGRYIINNLEIHPGRLASNHAIANYTGLIYLGVLFPGLKESGRWLKRARRGLEKEMRRQVYPDGVDFEASTCYHALVLECFLSATLVAVTGDKDFNGENHREISRRYFSEAYTRKLYRMVEFVRDSLKPNLDMPQIGDNDSGRLHEFSLRPTLDQRHLINLGAVFFREPRFKIREYGYSPTALLLAGIHGYRVWEYLEDIPARHLRSRAFPDGGIYVMRGEGDYLIISAGPNGQNGNGGHCHNDKLSFELNLKGRDIIVDPGSYTYTGDYRLRDSFRSTSYHNTVMIDGEEQNRFVDGNPFILRDEAPVVCNRWESTLAGDLFDGEHHGYRRLKQPVTHRRKIYFNRKKHYWLIKDLITGPGQHESVSSLHFAPGIEVRIAGRTIIASGRDQIPILLITVFSGEEMEIIVGEGWVSRHYGRKEKSKVLSLRGEFRDSADLGFFLSRLDGGECMSVREIEKIKAWYHDM